MKVLITGGLGYLGSKLKLALEEGGHNVESFDLPRNILNIDELRYAVRGKDVVYHLAALAELIYTDAHPQETFDVNIIGTNNVARVCAEEGVMINFTSTCCIYGDPLEIPSLEDRLINPTDTYAMSKAAGEYVVKMWGLAKGLKYNILRFGTVYGPSLKKEMRGDMCIQKFLKAAIEKSEIHVDGDGSQNRNFIYIDDLVNGLVAVADCAFDKFGNAYGYGHTINLTGTESISVNDIAEYAISRGAKRGDNREKRKDDFHDQDVSITKAKDLLGWRPETNFKQGMDKFFNWLKKQ